MTTEKAARKTREPSQVSLDMRAIRVVGEARARLEKAHEIQKRHAAEDQGRIKDAEAELVAAQRAASEAQKRLGLATEPAA